MLLIDKLRRAQHAHAADIAKIGPEWFRHNRRFYNELRSADARYDFSESALAMAGDLKITTGEGLFQTLKGLLREPRTIWLECPNDLRRKHLEHLRSTILKPVGELEEHPNRVGIWLNVIEPYYAEFRVVFDGPTSGRAPTQVAQGMTSGKVRSRVEFDAIKNHLDVVVTPGLCVIDLREEMTFPTAEEFLQKVKDASDQDHLKAKQYWSIASAVHFDRELSDDEKLQVSHWSWVQNVFQKGLKSTHEDQLFMQERHAMNRGDPNQTMDRLIQEAVNNSDGEMTYLAAMLAVLECETSPDILNVETRKAKPRKAKARKPADVGQDTIRTVSLNVSNDLRKAYLSDGASEGTGTPRVRHFVRGHFFNARNGKLTYRVPHWRGSAEPDGLTVTQVK